MPGLVASMMMMMAWWRRQRSLKAALVTHPKAALGILVLLASFLLLAQRITRGDDGGGPEELHVAASLAAAPPPPLFARKAHLPPPPPPPPPISARELPGGALTTDKARPPPPPIAARDLPTGALTTDLCASAGSLHHVQMMETMIQPSYDEVFGAMAYLPHGTWLQLGANTLDDKDGKDPLKEWLDVLPGAWEKVFVEPIPAMFAMLEKSVGRWPNATAVNVAIAATADVPEAQAEMFCLKDAFEDGLDAAVESKENKGKISSSGRKAATKSNRNEDDESLPYWADQICSFDKSHIAKHFPNKETTIVVVTAWSLPELLRQRGIRSVEVLVIDTEGFDLRVLEQIPFTHIRPRLIVYEHMHLSEADQEAAELLLRRQCYTVWELDGDNHAALALYV